MRNIGRLDRRIELQQFTLTTDGDPTTGSWATTRTVWAERMDKGGVERFVSQAELAEASAAYRIRYYADVRPDWRIKDGSELWDVLSMAEGPERNQEHFLLVSRHVPRDSE